MATNNRMALLEQLSKYVVVRDPLRDWTNCISIVQFV